jgi:hypothetical protein
MQNSDGMQKKFLKCMRYQWHCMHGACGIIDTACTVHAKYDTACTIDERFELPWQPLKGISIKNIYIPELSYPTTKTIFKFKGASCLWSHWHCMHDFCFRKSIIAWRIQSRIQKGFSPWIPGVMFDEKKTKGRKSRDTVPLRCYGTCENL